MVSINLSLLKRFFRLLYLKLIRIHNSPQKISLGLAIGVFSGLLPATGPIAAITLAAFFRVNRFAALIGSLFTNTWLSIVLLIPALKLGSAILNVQWLHVYKEWLILASHLRWSSLLNLSVYKIILPVFLGYVTMALVLAFSTYLFAIAILTYRSRRGFKNRGKLS